MDDASGHQIRTLDDLPWEEHEVARMLRGLPEFMAVQVQSHAERLNPGGADLRSSKHARFTLENGFRISVVCGAMFKSNGVDTYELAIFSPDGELRSIAGHLTRTELMSRIASTAEHGIANGAGGTARGG